MSEEILDQAFPTLPRKSVSRLYLRIAQLGSVRKLTIARAFSGAVAAEQWSTAESLLEIMTPPQRSWEHMPIATYYRARGDHNRAGTAMRNWPRAPTSQITRMLPGTSSGNLCSLGDSRTWRPLSLKRERISPRQTWNAWNWSEQSNKAARCSGPGARKCESAIATVPRFAYFLDRIGECLDDDQRGRVYGRCVADAGALSGPKYAVDVNVTPRNAAAALPPRYRVRQSRAGERKG